MAIPTYTDYSTPCGNMPLSFIQMLAGTLFVYDSDHDDDGDVVVLNQICFSDGCDHLLPFWNCNNNGVEPERALVENAFALDACGNLALKIYCSGADGREEQ